MTTQQFFKGLFMLLVTAVVTAFGQQPVDYAMLAVTAVSIILTYSGKNLIAVLHSDSPAGSLSWINLASGLLVAIGAGFLESAGTYLVEGAIIWDLVWKVVLASAFTYLGTTFFSPQHSTAKVRGFISPAASRALKRSTAIITLLFVVGGLSAQSLVKPVTADMVKDKAIASKTLKADRGIDTLYIGDNEAMLFRTGLVLQGFMYHYSAAEGKLVPDNFVRPGYGLEFVHCTALNDVVFKDYGIGGYIMPGLPDNPLYKSWAFMLAGSIYDLGYRWELLRGVSFNLGIGYLANKELQAKERLFFSPGIRITLPN